MTISPRSGSPTGLRADLHERHPARRLRRTVRGHRHHRVRRIRHGVPRAARGAGPEGARGEPAFLRALQTAAPAAGGELARLIAASWNVNRGWDLAPARTDELRAQLERDRAALADRVAQLAAQRPDDEPLATLLTELRERVHAR